MTRGPKIPEAVFAQIPQWVAQDIRADEIAFKIGCKLSTLKVMCSHRKISLRTPNWKIRRKRTVVDVRPGMSLPEVVQAIQAKRAQQPKLEPKPIELPVLAPIAEMPKPLPVKKAPKRFVMESTLPLSRVALSLLRQKAEAVGKTEAEYVTELLETIARDELFDAVLDNKAA